MSELIIPSVTSLENSFSRYLQEIRKFPMLSAEEEIDLACKFRDNQDLSAAHKLVTSHLKLVAKVAMKFKGYGLPLVELVSEGNIGLMQAVKKFNPDLGFRLSTYAVWWIKAAIQEYVLRSWSLVKIGTTAAQKKLFFNLGKIKKKIMHLESKSIGSEDIKYIASELNVTENEVKEMNIRMIGADISLNDPIYLEEGGELQDMLPETRANQEVMLAESEEAAYRKALFKQAMQTLSERERHIINERRLKDQPTTLEILAEYYRISCERVRQIEVRAIEKLQEFILEKAEN